MTIDPGTRQASSGHTRVTLTKSAPAVSLSKVGGAKGILRVNLNWTATGQPKTPGGLIRQLLRQRTAPSPGIDLDLGCLYEYTDGSKGVVQALGNAFHDVHTFGAQPIIRLDGDDRSGESTDGENLFIDLRNATLIRRILVFAYIYEGSPNWAAAHGVVTLHPISGPQVVIHLDEYDPESPMVAIALLTQQKGEVIIDREVRYIRGAQDALDRAYGWGMDWTPGRK